MRNSILSIAMLTTVFLQSCVAQINNTKTESVKIYGNCGMCETNIETAGNLKRTSKVDWNQDTKTATLTFDSTKTNQDEILKRIALAGYDSDNFLAPDEAYNKLHGCCQYERAAKKTAIATTTPTITKDTTTVVNSPSEVVVLPLADVYAAYFGLKDALTKDDGTLAATIAKELFKAVDAVPMEKLNSQQHTIWMKNMKDISYNAEHIKTTTETEHQREHFAKLSTAMIEVMKIIKPDFTVYIDHCPMFNSGKGADWLSKESGIKNPYYGNMMLTCGKTIDTLK